MNFSALVTAPDEAFLLLAVLNMWNKVVFVSNKVKDEDKESWYHQETLAHVGGKVVGYYTEARSSETSPSSEKKSNGKPG